MLDVLFNRLFSLDIINFIFATFTYNFLYMFNRLACEKTQENNIHLDLINHENLFHYFLLQTVSFK